MMDVMIGIAPHRNSHTAVVVDGQGEVLDQLRIAADRRQLALLVAFADKWPRRRFAVEGANGLGRLLAQQLLEAGETVIDVPPTLSARARLLSGGSARKTDAHDARRGSVEAGGLLIDGHDSEPIGRGRVGPRPRTR